MKRGNHLALLAALLATAVRASVLSVADIASMYREIAARLGVSENGAKVHLKHVNEKLDAKDRVDAVAIGLRKGLLHS